MRELRQRARAALASPEVNPSELPDTALMEAMRSAYQQGKPHALVEMFTALLDRANEKAGQGARMLSAFISADELARLHAEGQEWLPIPMDNVTVTDNDASRENESGGRDWEYPPSVKARAVEMKAKASRHADIAAMIHGECGRAPQVANLSKLLKLWGRDSAVLALVEGHAPAGESTNPVDAILALDARERAKGHKPPSQAEIVRILKAEGLRVTNAQVREVRAKQS